MRFADSHLRISGSVRELGMLRCTYEPILGADGTNTLAVFFMPFMSFLQCFGVLNWLYTRMCWNDSREITADPRREARVIEPVTMRVRLRPSGSGDPGVGAMDPGSGRHAGEWLSMSANEEGPAAEPTVTIITITKNAESCVERTIVSVIGQTYGNIRYLLVDGASTDGTVDIIKRYARHIHRWVSEPDSGPNEALDRAFSLVELPDNYVLWLMAGDQLHSSDAVAQAVQKGQGADLIYGRCLRRDEDTGWTATQEGKLSRGRLMLEMPVNIQSVLARRSVYDRVGGMDRRYEYRSDYDWLIRAHRLGDIVQKQVDLTICIHYWGGRSSSNKATLVETLRILQTYYPFYGVPIYLIWSLIRVPRKRLGQLYCRLCIGAAKSDAE